MQACILMKMIFLNIVDENIKKDDVDLYIKHYPDKIYRYIYEMRLYDVFA